MRFRIATAFRVRRPARNATACRLAHAALPRAVASGTVARVGIGRALQGAGKSSRIARQVPGRPVSTPTCRGRGTLRLSVIATAYAFAVPLEAVWIQSPLPVAPGRNRRPAPDRRVPEAKLRSVNRLFEPPPTAAGCAGIRIVEP